MYHACIFNKDCHIMHCIDIYCIMQPMLTADMAGWGIAWYLNGLLIPKVTVFRGITYTFTVEGGEDATRPANYHPFYITDSNRGGYLFLSPENQQVNCNQTDSYFPL